MLRLRELVPKSLLAASILAGSCLAALAGLNFETGSDNIFHRPRRSQYFLNVVNDKARGQTIAIVSARYYYKVFETVDELRLGLGKLPERSVVRWVIHKDLPPGGEKFRDFCATKNIEFYCRHDSF